MRISGNFGGALAVNQVLALAPYDEGRQEEREGWVAIGEAEGGIGANTDPLWNYAEF